jgi:hypothetical protein
MHALSLIGVTPRQVLFCVQHQLGDINRLIFSQVKLFLYSPWRHIGRVEVEFHPFLTSALVESEWLIIKHIGPRLGETCPNVFENLQSVILGVKPKSWTNITKVCNGNRNMSITLCILGRNNDLHNMWNSTSSLIDRNSVCENYYENKLFLSNFCCCVVIWKVVNQWLSVPE